MRTALHVIGMFLFGSLCLLSVGLLFEARVVWAANAILARDVGATGTHPMRSPDRMRGTSDRTAALAAMVTHVAAHLDAAADALEAGHRTGATPRLDTAYRLGRVL